MRKTLLVTSVAVAMSLVAAAPALATSNNKNDDHKIGICHATGSKTNPYVYITVDKHAVKAHEHHQDGRDIIGVKSAKDCPTATTSPKPSVSPSPSVSPKPGQGGEVLGSSTAPKAEDRPATLPETGAGLSTLVGLPTLAVAGRAYLRSRNGR